MSPSNMIEDQPVHMDRVRAIKATMDEMKSQHEATHQPLQDILAQLGPTQAQNMQDSLPTRPAGPLHHLYLPLLPVGRSLPLNLPSLPISVETEPPERLF